MSTRKIPVALSILILAAAAQLRADTRLQETLPQIAPGAGSLLAFAVVSEADTPSASKEASEIALDMPPQNGQVIAELPPPVQMAVAPGTDRDDDFLPAGKQETLAALNVPEVAPKIRRMVAPQYPALARESRIQGVVRARVLIDSDGSVLHVARVEGQPIFREAVEKAIEQWEFFPAMQGTLAVRTWITLPFSFEL